MNLWKKIFKQMSTEPSIAFPYKPPSEEVKREYEYIFNIKEPLEDRLIKTIFDKLVSLIFLILASPIFVILKVGYIFESLIDKEASGPMIFYYYAISGGVKIKKYKIRIIKEKYIDKNLAEVGDWHAFKDEWMQESRTYMGNIVKAFYLDELPQFWSILKGDMSFVGPRPLACHHYERDLAQGNVTRKIIKGGLLGLGHIHKGTLEMGSPEYEYEYIDSFINKSSLSLISLDLWIIWKGLLLVIKGKGL